MNNPETQYRVIATAGHVDHGKSTLVKALTGVNPDRLREEQERQMTIDLGFAFLALGNGITVGIIDVPGHRDFIHNMLAGMGGLDAILLIIAADEGVMPQTREHVAIIDLLGIKRGIVALTKCDLVDTEWLDLVQEEVRDFLAGTSLANAPIYPVDSVSGTGIPELRQALTDLITDAPQSRDTGLVRMPIDRVFSLKGYGTVVTGTLSGGSLATGDDILLQPGEAHARIRSLQTHGQSLQLALPGSRVAANLVGVEKEEVSRGQVLSKGGWLQPTLRFAGQLRYLSDARIPLSHGDQVRLFSGTFEVLARIRLLETDALLPGQSQYAEFVLERPCVLCFDDGFIIRSVSPGETIGGGNVVDAHSGRRYRRSDQEGLQLLMSLRHAQDEERTCIFIKMLGPVSIHALAQRLGLPQVLVRELVRTFIDRKEITSFGSGDNTVYMLVQHQQELAALSQQKIAEYHRDNPLQTGMPKEALRRYLRLRQEVFIVILTSWLTDGFLVLEGDRLQLPGWQLQLSEMDEAKALVIEQKLLTAGTAGLPAGEALEMLGEPLFNALITKKRIIRLPDDLLLARPVFEDSVMKLTAALKERQRLTIAEIRDLLASNRRSTLAFLSRCDDDGLTRRQGDYRILGPKALV